MIIAVVGPTGIGKTKLSIALAKRYNGEIINADSMQVYKGLDVGTAKIKEEEKENIPHHLFDICEVDENYTVFDYQKDARRVIEEIQSRGKNVIFVGGTGLYLKAALFDYQFEEGTTYKTYSNLSNEELLAKVKSYQLDVYPHVNNRKRLVRLLNKLENEEKISQNGNKLLYQDVFFLSLKAPRTILYQKLDERVDEMFEEGLLEEVLQYKDKFISSKALQTGIDYKEFIPYLNGEASLEEVKKTIKKNTRHYAKRQETFFRHQLPIQVVETNYQDFSKTEQEAFEIIDAYLNNLEKE